MMNSSCSFDVQHQLQLLGAEHRAGGVAGVGDHNGPGMLVDAGLHPLPHGVLVALLRAGGQGVDLGSGQGDGGVIVGVEGLGNDDLVPVVQQSGHGHLQGLAAAGGGQDIRPAQLHADTPVVMAHRVQQLRHAAGGRVLQDGLAEGLQGLKVGVRGDDVRLADVQVIDLDAALDGLGGLSVELTHGGEPAFFHLGRNLHNRASN